MAKAKFKSSPGFTLIEMAIVLVVIGLILGMVYKGRQLVASAKVKKMVGQYNKIIGATNTFFDRYGFYPGDGCTGLDSDYNFDYPNPMDCTGHKNGYVEGKSAYDGETEATAYWQLLIEATNILSKADRESVFGQEWDMLGADASGGGLPEQTSWLDLEGGSQADPRISCAMDKMIDDGYADDGSVRTLDSSYNPDTDCWSLDGQVNVHLKVLP